MLFTCSPAAARSGAVSRPARARRRRQATSRSTSTATVETPEADGDGPAAGLPPDRQPRRSSSPTSATREVNREQQRDASGRQFTVGRDAARRHGPHGDRHPGDLPVAGQYLLLGRARSRHARPSRLINDNIAEICGEHPDRFVGLGTVPLQAPELAVAELERAVQGSLGLRGVEICHQRRRRGIVGAALPPDLRQAAGARRPDLHASDRASPEASRFGDHYFTNVIGNPLDTTVAVHHLIFGGVLDDLSRT